MKELIIRMTDNKQDIDILKNDLIAGTKTEKQLSIHQFIKKLSAITNSTQQQTFTPTLFDEDIIGYDSIGNKELFIVNQPEHKRIITTSIHNENKAFNIYFPNSIYFIIFKNERIQRIHAFSYKEFNGHNTKLYEYPMPNQLSHSMICLGNGFRDKRPSIKETLEYVIYAPYSHSNVTGIKSFKNTLDYFRYLTQNDFPYHLLNPLNKELKDIKVN